MKLTFFILLSSLALPTISSIAQAPRSQPPTGLQAIELARTQTGKSIVKLVRLSGSNGNPDPRGWSMVFHDPISSTNLSKLNPNEAPEPADDKYGSGTAPIYFNASRVNVDSPAAFVSANKEAAEAKIGFDRITFELRGQEFTGMPVWTLRLLNDADEIVGIVSLSAETGKTLRTVWLRRDGRREEPRVIDSALASTGPSGANESSSESKDKESRALPPIQNIEPPPTTPAPPEVETPRQ
jgi:hypothetical protein